MAEKQYCVNCGKCMTDADGTTFIGVSIKLSFAPKADAVLKGVNQTGAISESVDVKNSSDEFIQQQLGKYEANKRYDFCWECQLDSLFSKK